MLAERSQRSMAALERLVEIQLSQPQPATERRRFNDLLTIVQELRDHQEDKTPAQLPRQVERKTA